MNVSSYLINICFLISHRLSMFFALINYSYSFQFNLDPYKILKTGENEAATGDPLMALEEELKNVKFVPVPGIPAFTGRLDNTEQYIFTSILY